MLVVTVSAIARRTEPSCSRAPSTHPLNRAADAHEGGDLDVEVSRFALGEDHLPRHPVMRLERIQPAQDEAPQALPRGKLPHLRLGGKAQHGGVRAIEPGVDQLVLLAEMLPDVIEADPGRCRDLVQPDGFPRSLLGERDRGIENPCCQVGRIRGVHAGKDILGSH